MPPQVLLQCYNYRAPTPRTGPPWTCFEGKAEFFDALRQAVVAVLGALLGQRPALNPLIVLDGVDIALDFCQGPPLSPAPAGFGGQHAHGTAEACGGRPERGGGVPSNNRKTTPATTSTTPGAPAGPR